MRQAGFAYAQARMQARFAARPEAPEWQMIETGRDLVQALDAAKRTALAPSVARLGRESSREAVETGLRKAWAEQVDEVARWTPPAWRAPLEWWVLLPHLGLADADTPLALPGGDSLAQAIEAGARAGAAWQTGFTARLPRGGAAALEPLAPLIAAYLEGPPRALTERRVLKRGLERLLRARAGEPAAAFAFLGLMALDLERLRGALLLARMYPVTGEGEAA
ncbi:hypothetical protein [Sinisalibacter lacisalsi]|uniref:Uncharacterized protein n=1 Tax=Sinisalibacter lacisalsi TaxID=1526570 RepID=A0ABQ1QSA9_9RHOB|nr:hypothetical protein [Sinisalibacter lacisalsi]GGD43612.1 hypothetical protein GCM10011358_29300 [Sinisalibacter lacisalsi]